MTVPASLTTDPQIIVDVAKSVADRARILREIEGRRWAVRHGIRTASTISHADDGAWLATQRLIDQPETTMAYVESAWETAERLSRLEDPGFATGAASWRAPRWSVPVRVWRLMRAGIAPTTFVQTRRAAAALPVDAMAHHDYHRANVLNTPSLGGVTVVDWEYAGPGPRHLDIIHLIVDLPSDELAEAAWRLLLEHAEPGERHLLAVQLRWVALRTWASEAHLSADDSHPFTAVRRRSRWLLAQQWADEIDPGADR